MESGNRIGEYLRARRELIRPEEVGLEPTSAHRPRRRVPGLRREELALLAGISSDYYVRLEQGGERHPSAQVLDALAQALRLDDDATAHLHELASPLQRYRSVPRPPERVQPGIAQLIDAWHDQPAFVLGRLTDVLAANPVARALSPINMPGVNTTRAAFLDPSVWELYKADWDEVVEGAVAGLRALAGADLDDPRLCELVEELSAASDQFRRLWARHDVRLRVGGGVSYLDHPRVGPLELRYEKLAITGSGGQTLVIYHADPGTPSASALAQLQSELLMQSEPPMSDSVGRARQIRSRTVRQSIPVADEIRADRER